MLIYSPDLSLLSTLHSSIPPSASLESHVNIARLSVSFIVVNVHYVPALSANFPGKTFLVKTTRKKFTSSRPQATTFLMSQISISLLLCKIVVVDTLSIVDPQETFSPLTTKRMLEINLSWVFGKNVKHLLINNRIFPQKSN